MEQPLDDAAAPNPDADLPLADGGDEGVVAEDQDAPAMESSPLSEPDAQAASEATPEDSTSATALEPDAAEASPEVADMQPEPAAEAEAEAEPTAEPSPEPAAAPAAAPPVAEPETAVPGEGEVDMAPAAAAEVAAEQPADAPDADPMQDAEPSAAAADDGDAPAAPAPVEEQEQEPDAGEPAAAAEAAAGEEAQDSALIAEASGAAAEPSPPPAEAEAEPAAAPAQVEPEAAAPAATAAEPEAEAAAEPEAESGPVPEQQQASSRPASGAAEPKPSSRPASGAAEAKPSSRPASGAAARPPSRPATAGSGAGAAAGEPKASSRPPTAASGAGAGEQRASSRPPTAESSLVATAISRPASRAATAPQSYDKGAFMQPIDADVQLPLDTVPTTHILSLDSYKRNNIAYIEDDVLVTAAGNNVVFLRLADMSQSYMPGLDGGGIGAIAVHPTRKFLAVAEKCRHRSPNVYIYSYPELVLTRVMRSGTERAYSALAFNERGNMLATVGGYPDYLITLWNWDEESIILRSKAFSQDVYTVEFSPYFEGLLNTSGTGHIRFWKVATTFTGLKLQGQLGKFGAVELTDVVAFVEMPDGKVLSSTETGELLLWDGGLIKVVLMRQGKTPCHDGAIHVLLHDRSSNCIVTGGADGYVRLWQFSKINEAEAEEDSHYMCITPVDELHIPGARIKSLIWERHHWVIQDEAGALFKVTLPQDGVLSKGATVTRLLEFHSGGIVGMHLSPASHTAVTAGSDGSLRVYDYSALRQLHSTAFNQAATVLAPLDATGQVLAAGFADGVLRLVRRCADAGVTLLSACKPHKGRVTAVALSPDGSRLATAGKDGTVFFFVPDAGAGGVAAGALKPVAFTAVPAAVSCAVWSADGKALLCGTVAGTVVEVLAPQLDQVDSSRTFEVNGLVNRQYTFKCPKPPKQKVKKEGEGGEEGSTEEGAAADAPAAEGGEAGDKPAEEEGKKAEGEGAEGEGKEDKEEEEAKDEEAEPATVLTIRLAGQGSGELLLTLDGKAAGTVWQCSLDAAPEAAPVPFAPACGATSLLPGLVIPAPAPTTFFSYGGRDGSLLLMGSADGNVRVQQAAPPPAGGAQGRAWQASLHDMQEGTVTSVQVSFDGAYLLSAAMDGTLYVQAMNFGGRVEPAPSRPESLLPQSGCSPLTPDITNPAEYTIEEAKQKAEQDALMAAAETKKMGVREFLSHIRKEFEALLSENQARAESDRLPRIEFEIDPGLRDMMEVEAKQKEEEARLELAWETEKKRLALAKLKAFFLDKVEVERIVMYALQSKTSVTTFRTAKLPDDIQAELAAMQKQQQELQQAVREMGGAGAASVGRADGGDGVPLLGSALGALQKKSTDPSTQSTGDDSSRLTKADMRRLARKRREAEWASFSATRPDDKYESPADVAAIEEAERNMGDFKLKSDPSYVIPEEERMTPQRKRLQMLLLEEAIYKVKMDFNHRFLALREVKKKVISEINGRLLKLKDIEVQLALRDAAATPAAPGAVIAAGFTAELALKPEEQPEIREVVTEEDLEEFARKKEEEKKAAQGSGLGGFAGGGGGGAPPTAGAGAKRAGAAAGAKGAKAGAGAAAGQPEPGSAAALTADEAIAKMMAAVPLSEFERALQAWQKKRLDHAKAKLQEEVSEMVEAFDEALGSLRREKFKLEADVKMAEMKQLVHYQELVLLRDFDKREVILIQKRQTKLDDRKEIMDKIGECNSKLEQKRVELEGLISRRAAVLGDFDSLVPESDPFREPLSKIFHRRIKRSKKKASAEEDEDGEEEEEEEDGEEGDEDDDDGDEEVCPPGCDNSLYERVCEQREKRLDEDDLITEFQKTIEVVRKEKETAAKKQKLVEQSLAAIQQDITEFQREKQGRLNQIDVVVNLKMHQIEYLVDGRLPVDLSQGLVFSDKELEKLKRRIEELDQEKADLRARQKTLKKEHLQLLRDKRAKEARVAELEAKAYDVQMLKFGQVIDLDLLDRIGASKGTEELKEQLKSQEAQYAKELVEWDKKISARTDELMALTRENTNCLNAVSELTMSQRKLESSLATARTTMFSDPVVQRKQEVEERDQLVQLVNAQATEIQKLKAQINALHRKDTSVYQ